MSLPASTVYHDVLPFHPGVLYGYQAAWYTYPSAYRLIVPKYGPMLDGDTVVGGATLADINANRLLYSWPALHLVGYFLEIGLNDPALATDQLIKYDPTVDEPHYEGSNIPAAQTLAFASAHLWRIKVALMLTRITSPWVNEPDAEEDTEE